ncbi:MAG: helix-turn-helix transcriptional regulator [Treponemataceae bacterium]|nr:helix-turn-helix transcriptional regulator [Spirochaetales bacterium]MDY6030859.1 helix-turn-helix transcriptional regulator [Treponemataceae bacterium]
MMTGTEILETLSANIKSFRKEKGWTQEKLAEVAEMSVQAINFFEGKRRWPGEDSLSKLADALGVEVYQLFVPRDKTPVIIEETPENEKIRTQITEEVVENIRRILNKTLDKVVE